MLKEIMNRNISLIDLVVTRPPIEALLWGKNEGLWPKNLFDLPMLQKLVDDRTKLSLSLKTVNSNLVNGEDLWEKVCKETCYSRIAENLYTDLSNFIEGDVINERVLLYLPIEYLPSAKMESGISDLDTAKSRFLETYRIHWIRLLDQKDARTDFFEGDIPGDKEGKDSLKFVVKAAHLLPFLLDKGIFTEGEILNLVERSKDEVLTSSLEDGLIAWNLYQNKTLTCIDESFEIFPSNDSWVLDLDLIIRKKVEEINQCSFNDTLGKSRSRFKWEKHVAILSLVDHYSDFISNAHASLEIPLVKLLSLVNYEYQNKVLKIITIESLRKIIETFASFSMLKAKNVFNIFEDRFDFFNKDENSETQRAVESLILHARDLGVIRDLKVKSLGFKTPRHNKSSIPNDGNLLGETGFSKKVISRIMDSPLREYLEPVVIMYGSKTKGYASPAADLDLAVIVKPHVESEKLEFVRHELMNIAQEPVVQFWTREEGDGLIVRDFPFWEKDLGRSFFSYVLLQGVWCGEESSLRNLYGKLLLPFLYPKDITYGDKDARNLWFLEMERDTLQYRLLHKGYRHAKVNRIDKKVRRLDSIDGSSTFWDPGYRKVATRLFIDKVFLPNLGN